MAAGALLHLTLSKHVNLAFSISPATNQVLSARKSSETIWVSTPFLANAGCKRDRRLSRSVWSSACWPGSNGSLYNQDLLWWDWRLNTLLWLVTPSTRARSDASVHEQKDFKQIKKQQSLIFPQCSSLHPPAPGDHERNRHFRCQCRVVIAASQH